jgi:two-component system OmpR family sensor kinase
MRRWRDRRLHHQLFVWLALSILAAVGMSGLVLGLLVDPERAPFGMRVGQITQFASHQFAERWDDAHARAELARNVARAFGATLIVTDAEGRPLFETGSEPCRGQRFGIDVQREGGERLGRVDACMPNHRHIRVAVGLSVLGTVCLVLWTAAALLARRITRPLSLLIDTTREIGSGNLRARVRLGRHQQGELRLLAEAVNDMARRIERQMQDQRELLAAVSHEVRSPLARLRLGAEILRTDPANTRALDSIETEVVELDGLVGNLLASSRLDFETLSPREVALAEIFRQVLARHQLPVSLLDDRSAGSVACVDPTLISRALDNLLDNAVRHGAGVARCSVHAASSGAWVFEVHDRGPGFTDTELAKVFEAFYRGPAAAQGSAGSLGLGLALVRRIALAHGGDAWAKNLAGGGAVVAFTVSPRRVSPAGKHDSVSETSSHGERT